MCGVCERIKETKAGDNPFLVKELETGYVVIGDFQHFKGYTLFLYKDHVVELFDLDKETRAKHLYEMTLVVGVLWMAITLYTSTPHSYTIIGGADGPTSIFLAGKYGAGTIITAVVGGLVLAIAGIILIVKKGNKSDSKVD